MSTKSRNENTAPAPEGLFTDYFRLVRQDKSVATITDQNIGTIAAWLRVSVDYSDATPALLVPRTVYSVEDGKPVESVERFEVGDRITKSGGRLAGIRQDYEHPGDEWERVQS